MDGDISRTFDISLTYMRPCNHTSNPLDDSEVTNCVHLLRFSSLHSLFRNNVYSNVSCLRRIHRGSGNHLCEERKRAFFVTLLILPPPPEVKSVIDRIDAAGENSDAESGEEDVDDVGAVLGVAVGVGCESERTLLALFTPHWRVLNCNCPANASSEQDVC